MNQRITITIDIDEHVELDLYQNLETLKRNGRLSEFCNSAIRTALLNAQNFDTINKKIQYNDKGELRDRETYFKYANERINKLEQQLDQLRYDMHTAACLANKIEYKEISNNTLTILDTLFANVKELVRVYPGDYADTYRWREREESLHNKFKESLSNFRLVSNALKDESETTKESQQNITVDMTEVVEKCNTILAGIDDLKETLRTSPVLDDRTAMRALKAEPEPSSTPAPTAILNTQPVEYKPVEEFEGDLSDLNDFFGGL